MANKTLSFSLKIDGVKSQLSDLKELENQKKKAKIRKSYQTLTGTYTGGCIFPIQTDCLSGG